VSGRATRWLAFAVVTVVAADWLSKFWIANRIALGETLSLVDGWLYLAHRRNPGVAFSMFAELPDEWRTGVLALVSVVAVIVLARLAMEGTDHWVRTGCALAIAGAIGNLGDRMINGGVTDFILFSPFPYVFNVADAAITVGAVLLAVHILFGSEPVEPHSAAS
jgi:signal peptidase II